MYLTSLLLLQDQGAGIPDTVVMIAADRGLMETLAAGGQFAVSILVLIMLIAIVFVLFALRKSVGELTKLLTASSGDITAAAHSVRHVAEDVRGITQSVKTDVGAVSDTIRLVNSRVRRGVRRAEARLHRLDALVGVAQEEAEDFVLSSASTLRGVRLGAAALKRSFLSTRRRGLQRKKRRAFRDDELDAAAPEPKRHRPRIRKRVVDQT